MKPKSRIKKEKAKAVSLKSMTCSQLADWISTIDANINHPIKNKKLIERYSDEKNMRLLGLCGNLPARNHYQWCLTARHLDSVPVIEMKVTGGKPDEKKMPLFTASLKRIAAQNGIIVHRWGKGAFILAHPLKKNA